MFPENPFFTLAIRRRKHHRTIQRIAAVAGIVALLPAFASILTSLLGQSTSWVSYLWLAITLCLFAGAWSLAVVEGASIIAVERREGTFDNLRLLPLSAGRWIIWKLQFPFLMVALIPASALPGMLIAAVLGIVSVERVAEMEAQLVAVGAYWVLFTVMPEEPEAAAGQSDRPRNPQWRDFLHYLGWCGPFLPRMMLGMAVPLLAFLPGQLNRNGNTRFFLTWISPWWIIGIALLTLGGLAVVHAHQALTDTAQGELTSQRIRWWGFGVEWLLLTGLVWWLPDYRLLILAILLIPLLTLVSPSANISAPKTTSNPQLEAELDWLAKRYPNPAFLCNLRFGLGKSSLRGRALSSLLWLFPLTIFLIGGYFLGHSSEMGSVQLILVLSGSLFSMPALCGAIPSRTTHWWLDERSASQLTLTPLTSREWVAGQIAASFLANQSRYWSLILLMAASLVWAGAVTHWGYFVPGLCNMAALLLLAPVFLGYPDQLASSPAVRPILRTTITKVLPLALGFGALLAAGFVLGSVTNIMPWAEWLGAALSLAALALAVLLFQTRLQQWAEALELVRRGEAAWQQIQVVRK